ncbi:MAG: hypothetical protein K2Y22_16455 [Candidatus Obscuribacterales bacterium]|nr:hypothetical protein [Candidatus Obscuribacterales bacterium]
MILSRLIPFIAAGLFLVAPFSPCLANDTTANQNLWLQLMQKGSSARQAGNLDMCEQYWRQALELSNTFAINQNWQDQNIRCLMSVLSEQGKCSNLKQFFQALVAKRKGDLAESNPSLICPLDALATTFACAEKTEEAESTYKQAWQIANNQDPKDDHTRAGILIHQAQLHAKFKLAEAETELKQALDLLQDAIVDPLQPVALRQLAEILTKQDRSIEAVAMARYACDLAMRFYQSPTSQLSYNQTLASACMKAERFGEAIYPTSIAKTYAKKLGRQQDFEALKKQLYEAQRLTKLKPKTNMSLGNKAIKWQVPGDLIY